MNEYTAPSALVKWFGNGYNQAGLDYSLAGFTGLAAADLERDSGGITESNYGIMAGNARTQASELELRAVEESNILRKRYLAAVGNATYSAAARNYDVSRGGTLRTNLERSSMELGDDIQTINKNAERKAATLNKQADIYEKIGAAYAKYSKHMSRGKLWGSIGSLGMGLAMFGLGSSGSGGWGNTGAAYGQSSTIGVNGVPMYGGSMS